MSKRQRIGENPLDHLRPTWRSTLACLIILGLFSAGILYLIGL